MANEVIARLNPSTGRLAPGGAPLHDDLDGLTGHVPAATGQSAGLMPQTNGDGTWGLVPTPAADPWTAQGAILAATKVGPSTQVSHTAGAGGGDYNAPTLAVTFTVPDSGNVLVHLEAPHSLTSATTCSWMLRDTVGVVAGSVVQVAGDATIRRTSVNILITGLTPSTTLTWTWAGQTSSGSVTSTITADDGSAHGDTGPALIVVRDAPF